jgi:hypothetical protein
MFYTVYEGSDFHPRVVFLSMNSETISGWGKPLFQTDQFATFLHQYHKLPRAWVKITSAPDISLAQLRAVKESVIPPLESPEDVDTVDKEE